MSEEHMQQQNGSPWMASASRLGEAFHMQQAARVGDRVEISGQGGLDEDGRAPAALEDEIALAFDNVERTLRSVGAEWRHVYSIVSYHVPSEQDADGLRHHVPIMVELMRRHLPERRPIWTCIGVATLGEPAMRVEITVVALVDD